MRLISHRGNITGPNPKLENTIEYINQGLDQGYDVEVDIHYIKGKLYLGHDNTQEEVQLTYLANPKLWCHAKNVEALYEMNKFGIHCFWHQEDDYTLTSRGFIWTFPKKLLYYNSICVLPEQGYEGNLDICAGICSDYIEEYK